MNRVVYAALAALSIVLSVACKKEPESVKISINPSEIKITFGKTAKLEAVTEPKVTAGLQWWSDNFAVASVASDGTVTAKAVGVAKVHVKVGDSIADCTVTVTDPSSVDPSELGDSWLDPRESLKAPLSNSIIFSKGVQLYKKGNVMQGWDFTDERHFYYAQCPTGNRQYISFCNAPSASMSNYMTLGGFGHMTQITAEACTDGSTYIWCNSNGQWVDGSYNNSFSISRFKYVPDGTCLDGYAGDTWVLQKMYNGKRFYDLQVAVDFNYRRLLIGARVAGVNIRFHWVFDLDEALNLPLKDVTIDYTAESGKMASRTIKARDLADCKILGYFEVPRGANPSQTYYYSHQGHEVHGDYVWFYEGQVDTNTTPYTSVAFITVYNYDGTVAIPRTEVMALRDDNAFKTFGFTYDGNAEGECMKIKDGKLYLGFACHSSAASSNRIQNILVYDCKKH